jgi:hypothetical protein
VGGSVEPYARAVALQPARPDYSRNYAIVLSDTRRYDEAIAETRRSIELQQRLGDTQSVSDAQQLGELIQQAQATQ